MTIRGGPPRLVLLALPALASLLLGCGVRSTSPAAGTFTPRTKGVLTVAMSGFPTQGFWEGSSPAHPTGGLEYELARDLASRFGLGTVRVVVKHFHQIVAGDLGGADLALDLITPTSQRAQHLAFSAPYLVAAPTIVVRSGISVPDLRTAQSLRWGATRATLFIDDIRQRIDPNAPARIYDQETEMMTALDRGQINAVLLDLPLAVATARQSGGRLQVAAQLPVTESIAAALPPDSSNLQGVSSAIRAFLANGTINRLLERWVGSSAADAETAIPLLNTTR
ncbi:MAG: amino acid ABC transporter substrate-binding protein [Solirubrobacterales bacterium]|nr:amino acid ABC transporter substrate-binding protein [Solirubrobacterales bacterium]